MKNFTFVLAAFLSIFINVSMIAQTATQRQQFYSDYKKAIEDKSALINADPVKYQQALHNGWFEHAAKGLKAAEEFANGYPGEGNIGGSPMSPLSGNGLCVNATPFCTSGGTTFPAGINTGMAEAGPDYGCLSSQPNPAWFFMKILTGGSLTLSESNSNNIDVDVILWGPFTSPTCGSSLSAGKIVGCDFSAGPNASFTFSTTAGEYYMLLITNYSNSNTNITLAKTGGTATTDCAITQVPQPPAAMAATSVTATGFTANWTAAVGDPYPATSFVLDVSTSSTFTSFVAPYNNFNVGNVTTFPISSLTCNTTYYYRVRGVNTSGQGSNSNVIIVTTGSCAPPDPTSISGISTICNGSSTVLTANGASGTVYWYTASCGGTFVITGNPVSVSPSTTTTYYARNYNNSNFSLGCASIQITVNPNGQVNQPGNQSLCANTPTTAVIFETNNTGGTTTYAWTNDNTNIGLAASGGGNIPSFVALNSGTTALIAHITVTPSFSNTGVTCSGPSKIFSITVYPLPIPLISGLNYLCVNSGYYYYTTEPGMTAYNWNTSSGGTIIGGQGTNMVQVIWNVPGAQSINVSYTSAVGGCPAVTPTVFPITVKPMPGSAGAITGSASVCEGGTGSYSVGLIENALTYAWVLPSGATIASGAGTNSITIDWTGVSGPQTLQVYGDNLCGHGVISPSFAVTVNPLPADAGSITGPNAVCKGDEGVPYTVPVIANATAYTWTVPAGATIASGASTNSITVDYNGTAASGNITVIGKNTCGDGAVSPNLAVTVNPIPPTPIITQIGDALISTAISGNQWYFENTIIPGATGQTYIPTQSGNYTCAVTLNECTSDFSNVINVIITGVLENNRVISVSLYPNPSNGQFTVEIHNAGQENYDLEVINLLGIPVYKQKNFQVSGNCSENLNLQFLPSGVYYLVLKNNNMRIIKKVSIH